MFIIIYDIYDDCPTFSMGWPFWINLSNETLCTNFILKSYEETQVYFSLDYHTIVENSLETKMKIN